MTGTRASRLGSGTRPSVLGTLLALGMGAVGGVLAGVAWEALWTPPTGVYFKGDFYLDEAGLTEQFSGTGWFALVGVVTGLLLGALVTVVWRAAPIVALGLSTSSAIVATIVMVVVGTLQGPPDPAVEAGMRADYSPGVLDLRVAAWPAYGAVVVGALGALLILFGLTRLGSSTDHEGARPADMIAS